MAAEHLLDRLPTEQLDRLPETDRDENGGDPSFFQPFRRDPCAARCGADPVCRARCAGEERMIASDRGDGRDCLLCGRETGFSVGPELSVERVGQKSIRLVWTEVPEADRYVIHADRWQQDGEALLDSFEWSVVGTDLNLRVQAGYVYVFYVVAERDRDGARSLPSKSVTVSF